MASNEDRAGRGGGADIDPQRLCDAAEAALKAIVEVAQRNGGRWIHPTDIAAGALRPSCLSGYSPDEIDQASRFLVRMGIIEPRRVPRQAA